MMEKLQPSVFSCQNNVRRNTSVHVASQCQDEDRHQSSKINNLPPGVSLVMHHFWSIIDFFKLQIYRPNLILVIIIFNEPVEVNDFHLLRTFSIFISPRQI